MKSRKYLLLIILFFFVSSVLWAQESDTTKLDEKEEISIPTFTLSAEDIEGIEQSQNISALLQSSRDIFVNRAGYTFGPARFKIRGYDSEYTSILLNGVEVNDAESGRAYWATWGGLNDAVRNQDIKTGINASDYGFGRLGGITNINTRASSYRKQVKVTYSLSNRSYRNRMMFIASTGLLDNGWSFVVSGSHRWAQQGYVKGTFYNAYSYFVSAEKKFNDKHSLGLVAFGSPNKRGRSGGSTQEAYDLAGTNYYNAYWGFQNGEIRNARVANYHQPVAMLTHYWTPNKETKITTTINTSFGRGGSTALSWAETGDPRPDYYRNLPSYYLYTDEMEKYEYSKHMWENDEAFRQIDWDYFYFANSKFLFTVNDVDGVKGNDLTALRSKYIVEEWRNDKVEFGFHSTLNHDLNEHIKLSAGINYKWYKGMHFKTVVDLLGGEYWLDIDKYADQESFRISDASQSDLNNPNRIVHEGDVFGYDYDANIRDYQVFAQIEFTYPKVDYYLASEASYNQFWRTGHMRNGKFPDDSYGDSEKNNFFDYGMKGGFNYKINGKNFILGNALFMTQAPNFRASYLSVRTRDFTVSDLTSEKILSGDINYVLRTPVIKSRLSLYYTQIQDQIWARSFYSEVHNTFVNFIMTGVEKSFTGTELGVEAKLSPTLSLNGVWGKGMYIYSSRPNITVARDNDAELISENEKAYIKNYYIGGRPQTVGSFGVKYNSPKFWFASANINYIDDHYIQINPDKRTVAAVSSFNEGDMRLEETLLQEKFPSAFTLDFFGGKSWKLGDYYVFLMVSVSNILDRKDIKTGGYEQYRFDPENIRRFPPKYYYLYGRTYFINLSVRF